MPLSQTIQFNGASAEALYRAYLSSAQHAAMTVDGTYAATYRRRGDDVDTGAVATSFGRSAPPRMTAVSSTRCRRGCSSSCQTG